MIQSQLDGKLQQQDQQSNNNVRQQPQVNQQVYNITDAFIMKPNSTIEFSSGEKANPAFYESINQRHIPLRGGTG